MDTRRGYRFGSDSRVSLGLYMTRRVQNLESHYY